MVLNMPLMKFSLICSFLMGLSIQPTISTLPTDIQNLESDDTAALPKQVSFMIDKIGESVRRFRCPKGWKRLGGSCYYFSNLTSISAHVNYTCNHFYSNRSNLIQIRNTIQLFYAAHVLSRNNLESLIIEIDSSLAKGKNIVQTLVNNKNRWNKIKNESRQLRVKYNNLTKTMLYRLNFFDLHVSRRSKKLKPSTRKDNINNSSIDEYEYDDLGSLDEIDEFEQLDDIHGICDDIHWNVLNDTINTTVYILTKYNMLDKVICSLSDVKPQTRYHHICEYVLDYCFANIICGEHGQCVNTLTGFKCACNFLYGGFFCKKLTQQGIQILISGGIILVLSVLILILNKIYSEKPKQKSKIRQENHGQPQLSSPLLDPEQLANNTQTQPSTILGIKKRKDLTETSKQNKILTSKQLHSIRKVLIAILFLIILLILYAIPFITYTKLYNIEANAYIDPKSLGNVTKHLVIECRRLADYRTENLIFAPCAFGLIVIFSLCIKRKNGCLGKCRDKDADDSVTPWGCPPAIEPFYIKNRFVTATIFGLVAFQVLRIFEALFFNLHVTLNLGVLIDLSIRITSVVVAGLQYYPVLTSLRLWNPCARGLAFLYIIGNIVYTIIREGSCMSYIPLSDERAALEEAKLRLELGTWYILYGSIKNSPHFFLLSYVGAEFGVRFVYDSICIPLIKHRPIWSAPQDHQIDDTKSAHDYVKKLLRSQPPSARVVDQENRNVPHQIEDENEEEDESNQTWYKKLFSIICEPDKDFRFTIMVVSTYTVAFIFLYYLACTFLFLYLSRTTGHLAYVKSYVESLTNKELGEIPFIPEIIVSVVITLINYVIQLLLGMQQFKVDKKKLFKKIQWKGPFDPQTIAQNSVHYSGFLIEYTAWGFVLCFHLILFIGIIIRILWSQIRHRELLLAIIVPIILMSRLRATITAAIGAVLFNKQKKKKADDDGRLNNPGAYAIFIYFMFFADCFLGIASSICRLLGATILHVLYMGRLDCSFFGSELREHDSAYAAYRAYLSMEANYTHPIGIVFTSKLWESIKKPPRRYYDEGCCATVGADDRTKNSNQNQGNQNRNNSQSDNNEPHNTNDQPVPNINHNNSEIELTEITETPSSLRKTNSVSTISKDNQQASNVSDVHVNVNRNVNSPNSRTSSICEQERRSSKSSPIETKVIIQQQHPPKRDQSDDDDKDTEPKFERISSQVQPGVKASKRGFETNTVIEPGENKDDEHNVKINDIIEWTSVVQQAIQDEPNTNNQSSVNNNESVSTPGTKSSKGASSIITPGTIDENFPKIFADNTDTRLGETTDKYSDKTIPIKEEHGDGTSTLNAPPFRSQNVSEMQLCYTRPKRYNKAIKHPPPIIAQPDINFSPIPIQDNTNDDIDIKNDNDELYSNNSLKPTMESRPLISSHLAESQTNASINGLEGRNKMRTVINKTRLNRWFVVYTLFKNPSLCKFRKNLHREEQHPRLYDQQDIQLNRPSTNNNLQNPPEQFVSVYA